MRPLGKDLFCRCAVLQFNLCTHGDFGSADDRFRPDEKFSEPGLGLPLFFVSALAAIYFGFFTEAKSSVYTTAGVFSALWIICSFAASLISKKTTFALIAHLALP